MAKYFLRVLCFLCLAACICYIFANSLQADQASDLRSGEMTSLFHGFGLDFSHDLVRKLAHFSEYALLGLLALCCLRVLTSRLDGHLAWPVLLGLLVALIDETIQLHVPGRSGLLADVWLDLGGVLAGVMLGGGLVRLTRGFWIMLSLDKQ